MLNDPETYAPFVLFEYDHDPGKYCLMLSDGKMGPTFATFEANGREGGGYGWADVALGTIRSQAPELESRLGMDPEAGMFVAYGTDLEALQRLGALLHGLFHDLEALGTAVSNAPWEYD
ncbi:MAG: immunity 51 family protein [Deltaproteobacteria bacterium]|nr:immunity 51 family protein [Deltaproteobacteria bacterium]